MPPSATAALIDRLAALRDDVDPNGINGRNGGAGYVFSRTSDGLSASLSARPLKPWQITFSWAQANGSERSDVVLPILYNDEFNTTTVGGQPVVAGKGSVREGTISGNTIQALQSPGGANIRFTGIPGNPLKVGVWSITGNHIANQETSIHLTDAAGVSITGNTFMRGFARHLVIERSRNIIVSANILDHNADYFTPNTVSTGGIVVDRSTAVIVSQNIIEGVDAGSPETGGALAVTDSRDITLDGNQVREPRHRGIHVARSANVRVAGNLVTEEPGQPRMVAAVELEGPCPGTVVRGNTLALGSRGALVNRATGATIETVDEAR